MRRVDSLEKTLMLGGIGGQEEKGTTEDEMAGWHHWLDGREFEWTPGVGNGQRGLACCNSWGRKESDMTEWLNWTELNAYLATCYKEPTCCNRPWCWERFKAGGEEDNRGWAGWMLQSTGFQSQTLLLCSKYCVVLRSDMSYWTARTNVYTSKPEIHEAKLKRIKSISR